MYFKSEVIRCDVCRWNPSDETLQQDWNRLNVNNVSNAFQLSATEVHKATTFKTSFSPIQLWLESVEEYSHNLPKPVSLVPTDSRYSFLKKIFQEKVQLEINKKRILHLENKRKTCQTTKSFRIACKRYVHIKTNFILISHPITDRRTQSTRNSFAINKVQSSSVNT